MSNAVAATLGLILAVIIAVMIGQSLRRAFARPGPTAVALSDFSLSIGRGMLLVAVVGASVFSARVQHLAHTTAATVSVLAMLALLLAIVAETRWPRQSGTVRVALLRRPTVRETVRARYLVGAGLVVAAAIITLTFFLIINPAVVTRDPTQLLSKCPDTVGVFCETGPWGTSTVPGFWVAAPSAGSVLLAFGLLIPVGIVAVLAIAQILRRPTLAGVDQRVDQTLRRIAAERIVRAFAAAALGVIGASANDLNDALSSYSADGGPLPAAIGQFLSIVEGGCWVSIFLLYVVGPNQRSIRQAGLLTADTRSV